MKRRVRGVKGRKRATRGGDKGLDKGTKGWTKAQRNGKGGQGLSNTLIQIK